MREIVLDTETTGFDPASGHRVVEIGCVELLNHVPSGNTFQRYINPERDMPAEAAAVHGLTEDFLADKPLFAEVAEDFLAFVGQAPVIAHNAAFDLGFINAELDRLGLAPLPGDRAIDTVAIARRKFPGAQASLDALCRRFNVDLSARVKHGALLDAELLAEVYLELIGGREPGLGLAAGTGRGGRAQAQAKRTARPARPHEPSATEEAAHTAFLEKIDQPLWSA